MGSGRRLPMQMLARLQTQPLDATAVDFKHPLRVPVTGNAPGGQMRYATGDLAGFIEKDHIEGHAHANGMNLPAGAQQQTFIGLQRPAQQQTS